MLVDRKGACEGDSLVDKDGGRDCRIRSNNCYGRVIRRDQESAVACWGYESVSRVAAIIYALVICIIVCLSWAVNHYRVAITYKEQRDKKSVS